jgi:Na+(H+)/acetate symporter ActP
VTELGFASTRRTMADTLQHGAVHPVADDRHRRSAARHHALLHRAAVADARWSAGWALVFIALLYLTAPAVGAMARLNITEMMWPNGGIRRRGSVEQIENDRRYDWMATWQKTGLLGWEDKNGDGKIQYYNDKNADLQAMPRKRAGKATS